MNIQDKMMIEAQITNLHEALLKLLENINQETFNKVEAEYNDLYYMIKGNI